MVPDVALILLGGGFALALCLAALLLSAPDNVRIHAHPNARSSHQRITPSGGGIVFVLPLVGYLAWVGIQGAAAALALAGAGTVLAMIGLWDDLREVSKRLRFIVQTIAAAVVAWTLLGESGWLLLAMVTMGVVWHVNLYNFMDGIDGLAGVQTLVFALGALIIGQGLAGWPADVLWLAAGSMLGFLVVNWPPARIFMGDVGSYFLGLFTGAVAVLLWRQHTLELPVSLILLSGFWFDATYTLIVRATTGQAFTQPHKTHLYQKIAAKRGHLWTTVCYLLYAVLWLLPLSWLCGRYGSALSPLTLLWLLLAVTPLAMAAWWLGAGLPEPRLPEAGPPEHDHGRHDQ